jgi:hypothetical protein
VNASNDRVGSDSAIQRCPLNVRFARKRPYGGHRWIAVIAAIRRTGIYRISAASVWLDVGRPDHLAPKACTKAMRETAGSAAAPAARWRNCRRGSFILNLPSHHSITSSARASSVGGTVRPSAFAVLRLMTRSILTACCTGKSAGFSPLRMRLV